MTEIRVTDSAADKVKLLIEEEGNSQLALRIYIMGGGCSGFKYQFQFDENENSDDQVTIKNGVRFLVDTISLQYLAGAEIDYKEDLKGGQFVIRNPHAKTTCGCGSSFDVAG